MAQVRTFHEITEDEVGKGTIHAFGRDYSVRDFMGAILPIDVGKRIYHDWATNTLSVENTPQRDARVKGYGGRP